MGGMILERRISELKIKAISESRAIAALTSAMRYAQPTRTYVQVVYVCQRK